MIEDLTAWLNTEGLAVVNLDADPEASSRYLQVTKEEVKAWCEAKGVCCLWRGGWRGNKKERAKKGVWDDDEE